MLYFFLTFFTGWLSSKCLTLGPSSYPATPTISIRRAAIANFNRCVTEHYRTTLLETNKNCWWKKWHQKPDLSIGETRVWVSIVWMETSWHLALATRKTWRKALVSSKMAKLRSLGGRGLVVRFGVDWVPSNWTEVHLKLFPSFPLIV